MSAAPSILDQLPGPMLSGASLSGAALSGRTTPTPPVSSATAYTLLDAEPPADHSTGMLGGGSQDAMDSGELSSFSAPGMRPTYTCQGD